MDGIHIGINFANSNLVHQLWCGSKSSSVLKVDFLLRIELVSWNKKSCECFRRDVCCKIEIKEQDKGVT